MIKKVYVLVSSKNKEFLGVFGSEKEALRHGGAIEVPTQVFSWNVKFEETDEINDHIKRTLKFSGL